MKNFLTLVAVNVVVVGTVAFAEATPPAGHPCRKIHDACVAAGFVKGGHKSGKGLHKDCMKPILEGRTVASVTVDAADVSACLAKHEAKKNK